MEALEERGSALKERFSCPPVEPPLPRPENASPRRLSVSVSQGVDEAHPPHTPCFSSFPPSHPRASKGKRSELPHHLRSPKDSIKTDSDQRRQKSRFSTSTKKPAHGHEEAMMISSEPLPSDSDLLNSKDRTPSSVSAKLLEDLHIDSIYDQFVYLCQQLSAEKHYCAINCFRRIRRKDRIWSCASCSQIFHLECVQKWSEHDRDSEELRCPQCRQSFPYPSEYVCFCGRKKKPKRWSGEVTGGSPMLRSTFNQYLGISSKKASELPLTLPIASRPVKPVKGGKGRFFRPLPPTEESFVQKPLAPHCCTGQCQRRILCSHPCLFPCHPGPCPPCLVHPIYDVLYCACGKTSTSSLPLPLPCGTKPPTCTRPCRLPRACGHPYGLPHQHRCHYGKCPACAHCKIERTLKKAVATFKRKTRMLSEVRKSWKEILSYPNPSQDLQLCLSLLISAFFHVKTPMDSWKAIVLYLKKHDLVKLLRRFNPLREKVSHHFVFSAMLMFDFTSRLKRVSKPARIIGIWSIAAIKVILTKLTLDTMRAFDKLEHREAEEGEENSLHGDSSSSTPSETTEELTDS